MSISTSIVVPVYNGRRYLEQTLPALRAACPPDTEILVVDDGSTDGSAEVASEFADRVIIHDSNQGVRRARQTGSDATSGETVIFVDADVRVDADAIERILAFFASYPEYGALTGRLARAHPNPDFVSQWKNLYVHYNLGRMSRRVTFVYGSVFAVRRGALLPFGPGDPWAEDSAYGQQLIRAGHSIAFLSDLEVEHLHAYSLRSLLRIDFLLSAALMSVFIDNGGWRQLGRGTGYVNAPPCLLASVLISPVILLLCVLPPLAPLAMCLAPAWFACNRGFLAFLRKEKGCAFAVRAIPMTLLNHAVRGLGLGYGALRHVTRRNGRFVGEPTPAR